jgi:hypothetical protein
MKSGIASLFILVFLSAGPAAAVAVGSGLQATQTQLSIKAPTT